MLGGNKALERGGEGLGAFDAVGQLGCRPVCVVALGGYGCPWIQMWELERQAKPAGKLRGRESTCASIASIVSLLPQCDFMIHASLAVMSCGL